LLAVNQPTCLQVACRDRLFFENNCTKEVRPVFLLGKHPLRNILNVLPEWCPVLLLVPHVGPLKQGNDKSQHLAEYVADTVRVGFHENNPFCCAWPFLRSPRFAAIFSFASAASPDIFSSSARCLFSSSSFARTSSRNSSGQRYRHGFLRWRPVGSFSSSSSS